MIQYFPIVTGSLTVLGNINVSGSITTSGSITISGSITSASFASTASYWSGSIVNAESASFASTASFVALAQSASNAVSAVTASFANNLTVAGTLTAQTIVVQTITSSVIYSSGSNVFGNNIANMQVMTGSILITGSVGINQLIPSYSLDVSGTGRFYQPLTNSTSYLTVKNNRARNAAVYTETTNGGFYAGTSIGTDTFNYQIYDGVAGSARLTISSTGAATFSSSVTAGAFIKSSVTSGGSVITAESTATNGEAQIELLGKNSSGTIRSGTFKYDNTDVIRIGTSSNIGMRFETNDVTRLTIASTGAATFSSTISAGAATFSGKVIGNGFNSFSGDISIASGATSTIYTMGDNGLYTAQIIVSGGSLIYSAAAIFYAHSSNAQFVKALDLYDGANVTLDQSAGAIRITNNGFATLTWAWSVLYQRF